MNKKQKKLFRITWFIIVILVILSTIISLVAVGF